MSLFEPSRLQKQPDLFKRFEVVDDGVPIAAAQLPDQGELIVFERQGQRRGLLGLSPSSSGNIHQSTLYGFFLWGMS